MYDGLLRYNIRPLITVLVIMQTLTSQRCTKDILRICMLPLTTGLSAALTFIHIHQMFLDISPLSSCIFFTDTITPFIADQQYMGSLTLSQLRVCSF